MTVEETKDFVNITNALARVYPKMMGYAATTAVNFFQERIYTGRDIYGVPFEARKKNQWVTRGRDKKSGRGILIDTGIMVRDIQKLTVTANYAIVGTTRISAPRAKAHNEGFKGTVVQHVNAFERKRWEKMDVYSVKTRRKLKNQVKVQTGTVKVKSFNRTIHQNLPQRQFMGNSPLLDQAITEAQVKVLVETIKKASKILN